MTTGATDPDYAYTAQDQRRLAQNLAAVYSEIWAHPSRVSNYSVGLFCSWHRRLFEGIRDHAGMHRGPDFGPEILTFGPNRSVPRHAVPQELATHCEIANRLVDEAKARVQDLDIHFIHEAIKIAAYIHADLIRIHPFIDGNGRVARLVVDWILSLLDFPCHVALHVPAQEYRDVLNNYYATHDLDPLTDLFLRAFAFALG